MSNLILIGAGGHARSCIDVLEQEGLNRIVGLLDNRLTKIGENVLGYPILGSDEILITVRNSATHVLVCIGQVRDVEPRVRVFNYAKELGYKGAIVISPRASVSASSIIRDGTVVMHGAIVNAGAVIGENCIVNTHAIIEHDVEVGDHCHISTGAILNGGVQVGSGSFVGSGATISNDIIVGKNCFIPLGARVINHVDSDKATLE